MEGVVGLIFVLVVPDMLEETYVEGSDGGRGWNNICVSGS